ncbi:MAG: hypothetical protein IT373_29760 [Polyangiaceae bacterium]|nr:hypothetical protein [Polyangiaceae bacterium]
MGQWVRYERTEGPEKTTVEIRLTRVEPDGATVFEFDAAAPGAKAQSELVVEMRDRTTLDGMVVRTLREKTAGGIVTIPPSGVQAGRQWMLKDLRLPTAAEFGVARRADMTVPAGAFTDCAVGDLEDVILGAKLKVTRYLHPSVPINAFVAYEGTLDKAPTKKVLLAFGTSGAKAAFP